ncbi:uncharacterized protein LTR77_004072 [Saxophila tyrrhenica]|uniref:Uncharacterized protein n=1 Tax=Saxophila tyrrhenica TaxID=1690608 RepID=A0AAV9PCH2_9PEZI|nr:hypothetical protein LTR77_004072 [Saxophila tyrrhenica]
MSSPLTAKRRKLNETSRTLAKPFVSPLRTSKPDTAPLKPSHNAANIQSYQPSTLAHTVNSSTPSESKTKAPSRSFQTPARSAPVRKTAAFTTSTGRNRDPAEQAAQRANTSLELQIRNIRNEIDTLNQAIRLTSSTTDAELEELTQKWKLATQTAAEELFGTVKERVCRMGGVQAWRESENKKADKMNEWSQQDEGKEDDDADCEFDEDGEELPEEEAEWRKKEKARMRQEAQDAMEDAGGGDEVEEMGREKQVWQEDGKEDDDFTVDMMLRSLHIDLSVIGWDTQAQRWVS